MKVRLTTTSNNQYQQKCLKLPPRTLIYARMVAYIHIVGLATFQWPYMGGTMNLQIVILRQFVGKEVKSHVTYFSGQAVKSVV